VKSEPGRGTLVLVDLPLAAEQPAQPATVAQDA